MSERNVIKDKLTIVEVHDSNIMAALRLILDHLLLSLSSDPE